MDWCSPVAGERHTVSGMFGQSERHVSSFFSRSALQLDLTWLQLQYLSHPESSRVRLDLSLLLHERQNTLQKLNIDVCIRQWWNWNGHLFILSFLSYIQYMEHVIAVMCT